MPTESRADELKRYLSEEFGFQSLLKAGNGAARGIWSDGAVVYVADDVDERLYTYNIPDSIDARLASLHLTNAILDEFSANRLTYSAVAIHGQSQLHGQRGRRAGSSNAGHRAGRLQR